MRLLFVCPDMRTGGAERHWATLAPMLRDRGAQVGVLCLSAEGPLFSDLVRAEVPARCLHMRGRADPRALRAALACARPRPDLVVSRGVNAMVVAAAIARRSGSPQVVNEHTPLQANGELLPAQRHQRLLTKAVAPHVNRVIAVTGRQIDPLVALGYRRERIEVIANGIEPVERSARADRLAGEGQFGVLCVSRLQAEKRVELFVGALAQARKTEPRLRGFVAGDGDHRAALERLAEASGVTLLGERSDVPALLEAADAFALSSGAEALPMSVLEAMARGVPSVAPDLGGVSDAVIDGETGFLFSPGDQNALARSLVALARDPERARRMGAAARTRQRAHFSAAAMADAYLEAFGRVAR